MAILIACHCSIKTVNHQGLCLKKREKGSLLEDIHMNRTKCSRLISQVIASSLFSEMTADLRDEGYSLIADESKDAASSKKSLRSREVLQQVQEEGRDITFRNGRYGQCHCREPLRSPRVSH